MKKLERFATDTSKDFRHLNAKVEKLTKLVKELMFRGDVYKKDLEMTIRAVQGVSDVCLS